MKILLVFPHQCCNAFGDVSVIRLWTHVPANQVPVSVIGIPLTILKKIPTVFPKVIRCVIVPSSIAYQTSVAVEEVDLVPKQHD